VGGQTCSRRAISVLETVIKYVAAMVLSEKMRKPSRSVVLTSEVRTDIIEVVGVLFTGFQPMPKSGVVQRRVACIGILILLQMIGFLSFRRR